MCPTICVLILPHMCPHGLQDQRVRERADSGGGSLRLASLRYTVPGIQDFTTDFTTQLI